MSGSGDVEAGILAAIQMPGVVPLSAAGRSGSAIGGVTSTDGLVPLPDRPPLDSRSVCVLGASLSRTVAEVHRAGIVHGSISLPVVLVDDLGRPVLTGFATASRSTSPDARTLDAGELISLLKVLVERLPGASDSSESRNRRRTSRLLDDLDGSPPVDISDGLTSLARSFGSEPTDQAAAAVDPPGTGTDIDTDQSATEDLSDPANRPSDGEGPRADDSAIEDPGTAGWTTPAGGEPDGRVDGQSHSGSDRTLRARVRSAPTGPGRIAAAGFMATGVAILAAASIAFFMSRDTGGALIEPEPLVAEGGPVVTYLGASYQIGRPGDVAVVRSCDGRATAWLLRPSTGAIYRFEAWATDEMVVAEPIRIVAGGQSLRLAHSLGCTDVHVETTDGRSVPLTDGS